MTQSSSSVIYSGNQDIAGETERDGYFILPGFFDLKIVEKAKAEMAALLDRDLAARAAAPSKAVRMDEERFHTTFTDNMHTRLFPSWESPAFAEMVADMFASPIISDFMGRVIGEHYRLRVDLIRRSTGVDDTVDEFQLPHEWHRDTAGEFTFGIFFDDVSKPHSGGTAVIPGTHWEKLDPRWDLLLSTNGRPLRSDFMNSAMKKMPDKYYEMAKLNQEVRHEIESRVVEIRGRPGDIYLFLNDTWHGRHGNKSSEKLMISRIGGFPTDFAFKDDIPLPGATGGLPELLQQRYAADQPVNGDPTTLVNRLKARTIQSELRAKAAEEKIALAAIARAEFEEAQARRAARATKAA